jgi:predicted nucleic acid-binding protein
LIVLDTSVLIDGLAGARRSESAIRHAIFSGERIVIPTLVLYEWLRGPRRSEELDAQEALFPARATVPFGAEEAMISADLYRAVGRPRSREVDLAIASYALVRHAPLWTLNKADFDDLPELRLYAP